MADSLSTILSQIRNTLGTANSTYAQPSYTDTTTPTLRSAEQLNNVLGTDITYDRNEIESIYNKASKAAYDAKLQEQANAERGYYGNIATMQDTALDTIRQQYSQAIASGASKGMQAANTLSAILGTSQQSIDEATKLAQDRQALGTTYAAELQKNASDALSYSNETASTLATLSRQLYNDDIQRLTAQLAYNQGINTDAAGVAANQYTALSNLLANYASSGAGVYNNNQSAIAAIQAALAEAEATKYAADQSTAATVYAANASKGK